MMHSNLDTLDGPVDKQTEQRTKDELHAVSIVIYADTSTKTN